MLQSHKKSRYVLLNLGADSDIYIVTDWLNWERLNWVKGRVYKGWREGV